MAEKLSKSWRDTRAAIMTRARQGTEIKLDLQTTNLQSLKTLGQVLEIRLTGFVDEFVRQQVVPRITDQWTERSARGPEYGLQVEVPTGTGDDGETKTYKTEVWTGNGRMSRGHGDLLQRLTQTRGPQVSGSTISQRIGYNVMDLRSNEYSPIKHGFSSLNTWFLAVEWGTGIAENVGAPWVKQPGEPPGGHTKDPDGSWWLGPRTGEGLHIRGQKGFHVFWDTTDRARPRGVWEKLFHEEFAAFLNKKLQELFR